MKNLFFLFLILLSVKASGQNASALQKEKMQALAVWEGNWTGKGWMFAQDGKKHYFTQKEIITSKLGGGVLTVDGNGKDKETGKGIHDALGFITYDVIKQQYRFTAMTAMGYITDVVPEVKPNEGFIWSLPNPRGTMKFTIKLTKDEWYETGEISTDNGKTWVKTMEMKLTKNNNTN